MSTLTYLTSLVQQAISRLNNYEANAKKVGELPHQTNLNTASKIPVDRAGISEYITVDQIASAIQNSNYNQLLAVGTITVDGTDITVPSGVSGQINGLLYGTSTDTILSITLCPTGFSRKDIIVLTTANTVVVISGEETDEAIVLAPPVPTDAVYITEFDVNDSSIGIPVDPIVGNRFVEKTDFNPYNSNVTGTDAIIPLDPNGYSEIRLTNTGLISIAGYDLSLILGNANAKSPYPGKPFIILNLTGHDVVIKKELPAADYPFYFSEESDLVFPNNHYIYASFDPSGFRVIFKSWIDVDLSTKADLVDGKVPESQLPSYVVSGYKGIATQANAPTPYSPSTHPNGLFERYIVNTPITSPNSWGNVVVTSADLDVVNGVANNRVILEVQNGVVTKKVERVKGDAGAPFTPLITDVYDLVRSSNNIFNKTSVTRGYFVSPSDGSIVASASHSASDYIPIKSSTAYITRFAAFGGAWYDANKVFISGVGTTNTSFTSPSNAKYFRMGLLTTNLDTQQMNEGTVLLTYDDYYIKLGSKLQVDNDNLSKFPHTHEMTSISGLIRRSNNIFNKNKLTLGNLVNGYVDGALSPNAGYDASDYITVKPLTKYSLKYAPFSGAWYDSNKVWISGINTTTVTSPANAKYFRMGIAKANVATQQMNEGDTLLAYDDYFVKLGEGISIDEKNAGTSPSELLKAKKRIYSISDAVVRWKLGEKFPVAFMGDSTTDGATVSGYTANTIGTDDNEPNAYPMLLQTKLRAYTGNSTLRIYNAGFSGWNTISALTNFNAVFMNANYGDVKMIGFMYGINDRGGTIALFKENLIKLCLMAYDNGIQPFLITPQTILQEYNVDPKQSSNYLSSHIVPAIKDVAREFNLEVIDNNKATENFLGYSKTIKSDVIPDTLHFSDRGHQFEAEHFFAKLIGDTIEVEGSKYLPVTHPKFRHKYNFGHITQESGTFKRYVNLDASWSFDTLLIKCWILNSADSQISFAIDSNSNADFYYKINGSASIAGTLVTTLEIGMHEVEIYLGSGTTRKLYGLDLIKL